MNLIDPGRLRASKVREAVLAHELGAIANLWPKQILKVLICGIAQHSGHIHDIPWEKRKTRTPIASWIQGHRFPGYLLTF
jgi:hypothetical protein